MPDKAHVFPRFLDVQLARKAGPMDANPANRPVNLLGDPLPSVSGVRFHPSGRCALHDQPTGEDPAGPPGRLV